MAFAVGAVHRRHHTVCVDNGMTSRVHVDAAGNSSMVFDTRNTVSCKKLALMGDNAGCLSRCVEQRRSGRETTADVRVRR